MMSYRKPHFRWVAKAFEKVMQASLGKLPAPMSAPGGRLTGEEAAKAWRSGQLARNINFTSDIFNEVFNALGPPPGGVYSSDDSPQDLSPAGMR